MTAGSTFQDQDEMTIFLYSEELDVIELITYYHANDTQLFISANETSVPDTISADVNPLDYPMNIFRMVEKSSPNCLSLCIRYDEDSKIKSVWQEEYYDYNTNDSTQPTYTIGPSYLLKSNTERLTNQELSGKEEKEFSEIVTWGIWYKTGDEILTGQERMFKETTITQQPFNYTMTWYWESDAPSTSVDEFEEEEEEPVKTLEDFQDEIEAIFDGEDGSSSYEIVIDGKSYDLSDPDITVAKLIEQGKLETWEEVEEALKVEIRAIFDGSTFLTISLSLALAVLAASF